MAAKTLDPKQFPIYFGVNQITGFAPGSFIEIDYDEDSYKLTVGSDGEGARAKSNNYAATITVKLLQTSQSNAILSTAWNADRLNNGGVEPFLCKDSGGTTLHTAETSWVQKAPKEERSNEVMNLEWVLRTDKLNSFQGGN